MSARAPGAPEALSAVCVAFDAAGHGDPDALGADQVPLRLRWHFPTTRTTAIST